MLENIKGISGKINGRLFKMETLAADVVVETTEDTLFRKVEVALSHVKKDITEKEYEVLLDAFVIVLTETERIKNIVLETNKPLTQGEKDILNHTRILFEFTLNMASNMAKESELKFMTVNQLKKLFTDRFFIPSLFLNN